MFKYLFKALMRDDSIIEQTQEDKSATTEGRNCFYDVMQKGIENVRAFALYNQETGDEYLVDLDDGHFEVNQIPFYMHQDLVQNIRLVWFKRNFFSVTRQEKTGEFFVFGFQANNEKGENVKYLMTLT